MVHGHSRALVITMLPEPPEDGNELSELVAAIAHFVPLGEVAVTDVDELQPLTTPRATTLQTISARCTSAASRKSSANCGGHALLAIESAPFVSSGALNRAIPMIVGSIETDAMYTCGFQPSRCVAAIAELALPPH